MQRVFLLVLIVVAAVAACRPPVPRAISDEMAATPRGQATVVFFTDFECPYCRRTHAALAPLVNERKGLVRVVLKHVPLRRHPDARTAARAAICVEALTPDNAAAYAHALMTANDLSEHACAELAAREPGIDREAFERCTRDTSTEARIEKDTALFDEVNGDGVPLLFVGRARLEGAQTRDSLEEALDDAIRSEK